MAWVEEFIESIRPYVRVRLTDNVVIRMPNEAFKVNRSGARALHYLLEGGRVDALARGSGNGEVVRQLESFFTDLSRVLGGGVCDDYSSPALHRTRFALGYIELPILSEVALTWRCNLRCRFCYAACRHVSETPVQAELDTAAMERVLEIIKFDAEVPSVSFTGGEPLLRPDLPDLIRYAHTLGMRVNLITNGTLIDPAMATLLKKQGLASAQVSIESPDPGIHDHVVGQRGAHAASVAGLRALQNAGVHVHPHTTICRPNLDTVTMLASFARSLGMTRFSANLVIPTGRGLDPDLAVAYRDIAELLPRITSAAREEGARFMWYSPTPACLFNPVQHGLGNKGCAACEGLLSIDPAGQVLPCSSWREPLGSLLEEGFHAVWSTSRARHIRAKREAHQGCHECEDFALCQGACPLYFQANDYAEIEPSLTCTTRNAP
ncbi:MAG: radical SAM protein [Candidatus Eisenbacteria bacterium]|jgi:radical SAM protein with 4Fe4S-binding SPASM domain|nr:radical SAM protein [Candidatus Eisenbacteria bacterium]